MMYIETVHLSYQDTRTVGSAVPSTASLGVEAIIFKHAFYILSFGPFGLVSIFYYWCSGILPSFTSLWFIEQSRMRDRQYCKPGLGHISFRYAVLFFFLASFDLDVHFNINRLCSNDLAQKCHEGHNHWHH